MSFSGPLQAAFKDAIIFVGNSLPNKFADRSEVLRQALALLGGLDESPEKTQATRCLTKLVRLSPRCWGIDRRKGYWRIVFMALTKGEAAEFYLRQFPPEITHHQNIGMHRYLVRELGVNCYYAQDQLARFRLRLACGISLRRRCAPHYPSFAH